MVCIGKSTNGRCKRRQKLKQKKWKDQMKEIKEIVVDLLKAKDASRGRSLQTQVGPSELGGCARKVWYRLNQQPETNNNELKLAALFSHTESGFVCVYHDNYQERIDKYFTHMKETYKHKE